MPPPPVLFLLPPPLLRLLPPMSIYIVNSDCGGSGTGGGDCHKTQVNPEFICRAATAATADLQILELSKEYVVDFGKAV